MIIWRPPFGIYILLTDSGPCALRLFSWAFSLSTSVWVPLKLPSLFPLFSLTLIPVLLLQPICSFFHPLRSLFLIPSSFIPFSKFFVLCQSYLFLEYLPLVITALPASSLHRHPQLSLTPSHSFPPQFDSSVEDRLNSSSPRKPRKSLDKHPHRIYPGTPFDRSTVPGRSDPL